MQTISLPFGKGMQTVRICERNLAGVISVPPKTSASEGDDPELIARKALENPIGSPRLSELAAGKKKVVIITSDHTRAVPSAVTMPLLLGEIRRGNPDADITILFATGLNRGMTEKEMTESFG